MPVSLTHSPKDDKQLWKDHPPCTIVSHHKGQTTVHLALLQAGTASGAHSVMLKVPLDDGSENKKVMVEDREPVVVVELTAREFLAAAGFIRGKLLEDTTPTTHTIVWRDGIETGVAFYENSTPESARQLHLELHPHDQIAGIFEGFASVRDNRTSGPVPAPPAPPATPPDPSVTITPHPPTSSH